MTTHGYILAFRSDSLKTFFSQKYPRNFDRQDRGKTYTFQMNIANFHVNVWVVSSTYISKAVEARYDISQISAVRATLELVFIRSGCFEFSDTSNGTCIFPCKIDAFIQFLCTS